MHQQRTAPAAASVPLASGSAVQATLQANLNITLQPPAAAAAAAPPVAPAAAPLAPPAAEAVAEVQQAESQACSDVPTADGYSCAQQQVRQRAGEGGRSEHEGHM